MSGYVALACWGTTVSCVDVSHTHALTQELGRSKRNGHGWHKQKGVFLGRDLSLFQVLFCKVRFDLWDGSQDFWCLVWCCASETAPSKSSAVHEKAWLPPFLLEESKSWIWALIFQRLECRDSSACSASKEIKVNKFFSSGGKVAGPWDWRWNLFPLFTQAGLGISLIHFPTLLALLQKGIRKHIQNG